MSSDFRFDPLEVRGSGQRIIETAGVNLTNRQLVRYNAAGQIVLADASALATLPCMGITLAAATAGQQIEVLLKGFLGLSTWAWTPGDMLYVSNIAGALGALAGTTAQRVAVVNTATQIWFDPKGLDTGVGGPVCALIEGHTAYVGFDVCKGTNYTNYWTVDGVADNVQITAAIAYVVGLGTNGSVFVEAGVYHMAARVNVTEQVSIIGTGDSTRFEKDFDGSEVFELSSATLEGQIMRDFMIDGNKAAQTGTGIQCLVSRNVLIQNIRVIQCEEYGLEFHDCWGPVVKDCTVEYCGRGIYKSGTGNALVIRDSVVRFCDADAILLTSGNDHKIVENIIEKSQNQFAAGVRINAGDYIRILNNSFEDFPADGRCVYISGSGATVNEARIAFNEMSEDHSCIEVNDAVNTRIYQNSLSGAGTGVEITVNATLTHVFDNDNNAGTRISDLGTDTVLPTIWSPIMDPNGTLGDHPVIVMPDDTDTEVFNQIKIPMNFNEVVTAQVVVVQTTAAAPDMVWVAETDFGKLCADETYNTHSDTTVLTTTEITQNDFECLNINSALTGLAAGDLVGIQFTRDGDNAGDTVGGSVYYFGVRVRYV